MSGTVPPIAENFNTSDQLVATQQNGDGTTTDRLTTGAQVAQTVAAQLAIGGPLQSAAGVDLSLALVTPAGTSSALTLAAFATLLSVATGSLAPAAPNLVLAGPLSGPAAVPTARVLVAADLPVNIANGVAGLDGNISLSGQKIIATGAAPNTAISLGDFHFNLISAGATFVSNAVAANAANAALAVNLQALNDTLTNAFGTITNWSWGVGAASPTAGLKNTSSGFGALNALGTVAVSPENTANGFACLNSFGSATGPGGYNGSNTGNGSKVFINMQAGSFNAGTGQGCGSAITGVGAAGAYHNALYGHGVVSGFDYNVINPSTGILNVGFVAANPTGLACFGNYTCQTATTASYVFAGGYSAGQFVTTGSYLAFTGPYAGQYINTGTDDVANGAYCLSHAGINVSFVTASGSHCLPNIQTNNHTVSGYSGARNATTAQRITGQGYQVWLNLIDGTDNFGGGHDAGLNAYHGNQNIWLGSQVASNGVQGATGTISDGTGTAAGTILNITNIGTKNAGFAIGDQLFGTGFPAGLTITGNSTTDVTLTGVAGAGTYRVSSSVLVSATSDICNRDFSNTICVAYNADPTQNNQILFGTHTHTNFTVGGFNGTKAGGLMFIDLTLQSVGLGANSLSAIGPNASKLTATGNGSGVGLVNSTGGAVYGAGAQGAGTGDFNNICVFGSGSSANGPGQIVIGANMTPALISGTTYYDITIGSGTQAAKIPGSLAVGAALNVTGNVVRSGWEIDASTAAVTAVAAGSVTIASSCSTLVVTTSATTSGYAIKLPAGPSLAGNTTELSVLFVGSSTLSGIIWSAGGAAVLTGVALPTSATPGALVRFKYVQASNNWVHFTLA